MAPLVLIGLLALSLAACGGQSGPDGGGDNLPDRGVAPYERVLPNGDDGPALLLTASTGRRLGAPSALVHQGQLWLWAEDTDADGAGGELVVSAGSAGGEAWLPLRPALTAPRVPWGPSGLRSPSVIAHQGRLWMAFAEERGQRIGLAVADAPAGPWEALPEPALQISDAPDEGWIGAPSLVSGPQGLLLFYEARAQPDGAPWLARAAQRGGEWAREGMALGPGTACADASGAPARCWDEVGVATAEVRLASTATGRPLWRAMYAAGPDGIGFAASWDGETWSRYPFNPTFNDAGRQREPSNLRLGDDFLLFFESAEGSQTGIGLAVLRADNPTESF